MLEHILPFPQTLDQPASWINRAGRIDRSACFEMAAADVWRWVDWNGLGCVRASKGVEAIASLVVTAEDLRFLHGKRWPRELRGDFRTGKSNAMRPTAGSADGWVRAENLRQRRRASWDRGKIGEWSRRMHDGSPIPYLSNMPDSPALALGEPEADGLPANPNKGACASKVLGLDETWSQRLDVMRYREHAKLAQHFLMCPSCLKKTLKVFLPLATPAEVEDAKLARMWLDLFERVGPVKADTEEGKLEARLLRRYWPLVVDRPRELKCARCWGLRYGEMRRGLA